MIKKYLSIGDIMNLGLDFGISKPGAIDSAKLNSKKVKIIENSADEIKDVTLEMLKRLNKEWKNNNQDQKLQKQFWKNILKIFKKYRIETSINQNNIKTRIGSNFLKKNKYYLI